MNSVGDGPGDPGGQGFQPPPSDSESPLRESVSSAGERIQVIIEAAEKAAAGIIEDADAQARRYIDTSRRRADLLADERVRVMSDLTDTLIRQAEMVRRQSDELLTALDAARTELANRIGQELTTGHSPHGSGLPGEPAPQPPAGTLGGPAPAAQGQPQGQDFSGGQAGRVPHLQPVQSERPDLQAVEPQPPPPPPPPPTGPQPVAGQPGAAPQQPPHAASAAPGTVPPGGIPSDGARLLAAQMAVAGSTRQEIEARLRDEFGIQDAGPILDGIIGPG